MSTMRSRLGVMKAQMSKLRREMAELEAEIRSVDKSRVKEIAREKELTERFHHDIDKVCNCGYSNSQQISITVDMSVWS